MVRDVNGSDAVPNFQQQEVRGRSNAVSSFQGRKVEANPDSGEKVADVAQGKLSDSVPSSEGSLAGRITEKKQRTQKELIHEGMRYSSKGATDLKTLKSKIQQGIDILKDIRKLDENTRESDDIKSIGLQAKYVLEDLFDQADKLDKSGNEASLQTSIEKARRAINTFEGRIGFTGG